MKEALFIATFGILIYLSFATIFGQSGLIGSYGAVFSNYNHLYFGYISYIYLFLFLIPLYYLYKNSSFNLRKFEVTIASFLLLFSFLLSQSMLVENGFRGMIGANFTDFLSPYIGLFGLWVFWFIISAVSILIFADKSMKEVALVIVKKFKKRKKT